MPLPIKNNARARTLLELFANRSTMILKRNVIAQEDWVKGKLSKVVKEANESLWKHIMRAMPTLDVPRELIRYEAQTDNYVLLIRATYPTAIEGYE